jgi:hypothetical protein
VEKTALLVAVDRIIGRIEIENDLVWRRRVRVEEEVDEQAFNGGTIVARDRGPDPDRVW